jgi:hypothetical protein
MERFFKNILKANNLKYTKDIDISANGELSATVADDKINNNSNGTVNRESTDTYVNDLSNATKQPSIVKRKLFQSRVFINQNFSSVSKNADDSKPNSMGNFKIYFFISNCLFDFYLNP